jgi:hypothetical protein
LVTEVEGEGEQVDRDSMSEAGKFREICSSSDRKAEVISIIGQAKLYDFTCRLQQNCWEGAVMICFGIVPTVDRAYKIFLCGLFFFFGTSQGHNLCTREILPEGFMPVFRRIPSVNSWLYAVATPYED